MSLFDNLEVLMVRHDITQDTLADIAGVSPSAITQWKQGAQPKVNYIKNIADHYGITMDDLTSDTFGLASQKGRRITAVPSYTYATVVGRIAAGEEREAIEQSDEKYWIPPDILEEYPNVFYVVASGDSMNQIVQDGTYVAIAPIKNPETELTENDVAAVIVNGDDATLKHVKFAPEGVFLKPDSTNDRHRVRFLASDDPDAPYFKVLGKMVCAVIPWQRRR